MSDGPLSLLPLSPSPLRLISPRRGEKAKRPTLIPSSANDDTDTSAGSAGREHEEKGRVPNSTPRQPIELGSSLYWEKVCFQTFSRRTDNERVGSQDLGQRTPCLVKWNPSHLQRQIAIDCILLCVAPWKKLGEIDSCTCEQQHVHVEGREGGKGGEGSSGIASAPRIRSAREAGRQSREASITTLITAVRPSERLAVAALVS